MPNYDTTDRYALRALTDANPGTVIDDGFKALRDDISSKLTPYSAGTLASRPVSTPGSQGIAGREYKATDTGQVFKDNGTGWDELGRGERTHYAIVRYTAAASWPNSVLNFVPFAIEDADQPDNDQHATSGAANYFVICKRSGLYVVTGGAQWAANSTGSRLAGIYKNAVQVEVTEEAPAVAPLNTEQSITTLVTLAVNDQIALGLRQTSGGGLIVVRANLRWAFLSP